MHDKISARHYGVKPTGNGRRESYQHYSMPRMRNTYMLAGPGDARGRDPARRATGIYVEDVSNGQVKIGEGDFAFYVSQGRMIEDGKLGAPIKDVNIMGNGPKMLANIIAVANDFEMSPAAAPGRAARAGRACPVGFGQPTVPRQVADRRRREGLRRGGHHEQGHARPRGRAPSRPPRPPAPTAAAAASAPSAPSRSATGSASPRRSRRPRRATCSCALYVDGRYSAQGTSDLRPDALKAFIGNAVADDPAARRGPGADAARPEVLRGAAEHRPRPGRRRPTRS